MATGGATGRPGDGEAPIQGFGFNPPGGAVPGFELADLIDLRRRTAGGALERVHRAAFHALTLVTAGSTEHTIDFAAHPCRPGTLLWVRPGQVQRFGPPGTATGVHMMFTSAFPPPVGGVDRLVREWYGPSCWQLGDGPEYAALRTLFVQLRDEYSRPGPAASPPILQALLAAVLLYVDRLERSARDGAPREEGEVYMRFRAELERSFALTRRAENYARVLGYSAKTLTRACLAATGQPAKQLIDARVTLEAQRLLAHTDEPVAAVARSLGFTEPANFGKFFAHHVGTTPGAFRRGHAGPATTAVTPRNS